MTANSTYVSFPILKFDRTPDGDLVVYGRCTDGSVDADHQVVDPNWSAKALSDWLSTGGNVRVQHSPFLYPAGTGTALELDRDGDSGHWLKALVVEDTAKKLVEKRVLRDFSVGILNPKVVFDRIDAPGGTICGGEIGEVSLVDRGSNKNTTFEIAKSWGGTVELVGKTVKMSQMARMALGGPARRGYSHKTTVVGKRKRKIVDSGGRDVSHVPDSDFAGPNHTFPIDKPGDVPDAASLAHHADDPAAVRSSIRAIARRKFGTKDEDMPPSLQGKADDSECPTCHGTKKIRDGNMNCPDCKDKGTVPDLVKGDAAEDEPGARGESDSVADYNADSGDEGSKGSKDDDEAANKALRKMLRRQRRILKEEAARGDAGGRTPADTRGHPDPDAAEGGFSSAQDKTMIPAGRHREPDGKLTEDFEHDAGMHADHEGGDPDGVPGTNWSATKSAPSFGMRRLHDAVCPAFPWGTVRKSYGLPRSVVAALPVRELESLALAAVAKGTLDEAGYFTHMLEVAGDLTSIGPDILLDARKALPAMFPNTHPAQHPDVRPSMFQRDYLSAGRPSLSAGSESGHPALPAARVHEVSARDFRRGFLSAGHASASPGEGAQARPGTAAFGQALTSLQRMHTQVHRLWPDMCPIDLTHRDYTTGEGQTGIRPGHAPLLPAAPGESRAMKALRTQLDKAQRDNAALQAEVDALGALPDPEQAPYRGLPHLDGPVDRESHVAKAIGAGGPGKAGTEDAEFLAYMQQMATSGDPGMRLSAMKVLHQLVTK